jgi:hypothetical protein
MEDSKEEDEFSNDIYVWFFIRGINIDPNEITYLLGITPSYRFMRGDRHGENGQMIRKHGFWSITSNGKVQSSDLYLHIEWILAQLEPVKSQLNSIISNNDVHAQISCVFHLFTLEWDDQLMPDILERIAALNVLFGISIYCLKDLDSKLNNDLES